MSRWLSLLPRLLLAGGGKGGRAASGPFETPKAAIAATLAAAAAKPDGPAWMQARIVTQFLVTVLLCVQWTLGCHMTHSCCKLVQMYFLVHNGSKGTNRQVIQQLVT